MTRISDDNQAEKTGLCRGIRADGQQCRTRATVGGYCGRHKHQAAEPAGWQTLSDSELQRRRQYARMSLDELDAAARMSQILSVDFVREIMAGAVTDLAQRLDGLGGRIAGDLAAETDPALCRQIVFDECRQIRGEYAEALEKLFEGP